MSTGLYDTRIQGLREQQALARKLRTAGETEAPQGKMVSGWYVAPSITQSLAHGLRQGFAAYDEAEARNKADALEKRKQSETDAVMGQLYSNYQPQQQAEQPNVLDKVSNFLTGKETPEPASQQPLQANPNLDQNTRLAAMLRGSMVNPEAFSPMLTMEQHKMTTDAARANHQDTLEERRLTREDNRSYRDAMLAQRDAEHADNLQIKQAMLASHQAGGGSERQPRNDWDVFKDPTTGMPAGRINSMTGEYQPIQMPDGMGKVSPQQGKLNDANETLNLLQQAAPLVNKSTSSGMGALVDKAAGFVGQSTTGGDNAAALKAIGGNLVSKMPKMSGPQSDKDVALYQEMAGKIGDPTTPASQKQAAMQQINEINSRYSGQSPVQLDFTGQQAKQKAPATKNANGWELHVDGAGRKAYVNPQNPSQFEVVK